MPRFEDYEHLIYKEAWKQYRRYPMVDIEDYIGQGYVAFCMARDTWDASKGSFCTHLWWKIQHQLQRAPYPAEGTVYLEDTQIDLRTDGNPERDCAFVEAISSLSSDAKEVVNTIFQSSGEFCDFTLSSVSVTLAGIRAFFSDRWPIDKIEGVIQEIKSMLRGL